MQNLKMKTRSALLVSALILLIGCNSPNEPNSLGFPPISILNGQITNWTYGTGYSLTLNYQDSSHIEAILSSSIIGSTGTFSFQSLPSPPQSSYAILAYPSLNQYSQILENTFHCSDSSAMFLLGGFGVRDSSSTSWFGHLYKANFDVWQQYPTSGDFSVSYYYVTKPVNVSGTIRARIFGAMDTEAVELITHYALNYRQGWNEEVTSYTSENDFKDSTITVYSREYWYTNYEPSEGKWFYHAH
jgi:hypothetical protein